MHAHDAFAKANHLALCDGEIDLRARLALARAQGCRVVPETKTADALRLSVTRLPALLG